MTVKGRYSGRPLAAAIVLAGAASAVGMPVAAMAQVSTGGTSVSAQAQLESKTRLVKLLLSQSPAMQRIPQSGNVQAQKKLADARALFARAGSEAEAGRQAEAVRMLDEALREITAASRMVPDTAQLASQERARYAGMSETTRVFLNLYKGVSARMAAKGGAAPLDVNGVNSAIARADSLAASGNHKDANAALGEAYKTVVGALNRTLMAETIVYDQKFDTPSDEYKYELARNRNYEELVPLAIAQLNPPRESAAISDSYVQQSRHLRDASQKHAASGDYQLALKTIQDATLHLQRSLRVAGVVVPQTTESKP
ncbi:hypothetical protein [Noviherbaspirillum denitrificans]|uniref:Uncharacterized protein n=1 Tax=Noviherbaspirillum denitrificans TaxID=1968433 RepID=A0A254TF78_9BURK|nr:hypothetical protein [Noviherbaspirillum denitrificans]OWW21291.1 hypothetical protein AYR66_19245 [Noviherbaspirillum denitrificans]